jgi:hypothetical protein
MAVDFGLMGRRRGAALLTGSVVLLAASMAHALRPAPSGCFNDTDCPNQECGGEVCNWNLISPNPGVDKPYVCNPAGSQPKGQDGWCTTDENCKCFGLGARCIAPYCSFTKLSDAPGGPGGPGQGGVSSVAGTSSAGSPSAAGSTSGGTGSTSTPTTPTSPEPVGRDDTTERTAQACSLRAAGSGGDFWAALTVFLGLTGAFVARRGGGRRIPT